jgi:hypothetical protein
MSYQGVIQPVTGPGGEFRWYPKGMQDITLSSYFAGYDVGQ